MDIQKTWIDPVKLVKDNFEGEGVEVYMGHGQPCVRCEGEGELSRLEDYLREVHGTRAHKIFYKVEVV